MASAPGEGMLLACWLHNLLPPPAGAGRKERMRLTNAMELAVKDQVRRIAADPAAAPGCCWCPLCRADVMALALSSLPPRYEVRNREPALLEGVEEEVARAVRTVGSNPKHPPGVAVATGEPVWIVNFPLEEGMRAVEGLFRGREGACDCWRCRCDAVAFALNRFPARYGVEHRGKIRLLDADRDAIRGELVSFLTPAIHVVTTLPRH